MYLVKLKSMIKIFTDVLHHIVHYCQLRQATHIISKCLVGLAAKILDLQRMEREPKANIRKVHLACIILLITTPREAYFGGTEASFKLLSYAVEI